MALKFADVEETQESANADEQEFRSLVPKTGFLSDYMYYTDRQESPGSFHFWVAATILGAVIRRNAWVGKGIYNVFPNLYTVLVAPTGRCRKSRAINLGCGLIEGFDWLNIMADKTTPESLVEALMVGTTNLHSGGVGTNPQGQPTINIGSPVDHVGLARSSELAVFLSKASYSMGMVALLTDLYDCPGSWKYITRNKKPIILHNPGIQLLAASTPEWLANELPPGTFEGGFMSRVIFIVKYWRDRNIALPSAPHPNETRDLQTHIMKIRQLIQGLVTMVPNAIVWYESWYTATTQEVPSNYRLLGFVERKPDTLLKLALILAASELSKSIKISHLEQALAIIEWTQRRMFKAFEHVDLSPQGQLQRLIIEYLQMQATLNEAVTRRDLLRKFGGRLEHGLASLEQIMNVLLATGDVTATIIQAAGGKGGRPKIEYEWKPETP